MFFLEECKNDQIKSVQKRKAYTGNITSFCIKLAGQMISNLNSSEVVGSLQDKVFVSQCHKMLDKEEIVTQRLNEECSWEWQNIRKWIKFVYASLATIGKSS